MQQVPFKSIYFRYSVYVRSVHLDRVLNKLLELHKHGLCIVFVTQIWTGPVFANVLTWPGGTCWRRQHRWMNDPLVSLIKDWWHNPLSLYLFLSLVVFCSPSSFLTCSAIPAAQDDRIHMCVCVCNVSPKVNMGILACENLWFCVSVRVCLLMCPIIPRQHVCVVWLHHLSPCLGTWHWFSCALTSCRSWFSVSFGKTHTPSLQSPASIPPFLSPSSIHPDHSPPHLLIIRMAAVR